MLKVAVFTGTRADYGLLFWLLRDIQSDPELKLQLVVSGMHLSSEFGETYREIEHDGFEIDEKIEIILSSNTAVGTAKAMGLGLLGFADAFSRLNPDMLVILGDRFEAFAAAQTAMILRIPIIHLHGGEITEGAYDDSIRHAITKLSQLHGTSAEEYRQRVIQLGESPDKVKNVGALGLDHLKRGSFFSRTELSELLGLCLDKPYFLVTYHPVTLGDENPEKSFQELLLALDEFRGCQVILTYPNADDGGRRLIPMIQDYVKSNVGRVIGVASLGQKKYLSAIKHACAVVGNSSSGIIEVPSFNVPTVNVGVRQRGRLCADSIFHCDAEKLAIKKALSKAMTKDFKAKGGGVLNPYGQGDASAEIISMIKSAKIDLCKKFVDSKK